MDESFPPIDPSSMQVHHDKVLMNGDSAVVCKAQFLTLPCAAKYIHPKVVESSLWQVEHFKKGCKIIKDWLHPNIVSFLSSGTYSDPKLKQPILFMELMDQSLKRFLDEMKVVRLHLQLDICNDVAHGLGLLFERVQEISEENDALKRELKCANDMHQKEKKDWNDRINFLDKKLKAAIEQQEETEKEKNEAKSTSKTMYAKLKQMQKQNDDYRDTPEKSDKFAKNAV